MNRTPTYMATNRLRLDRRAALAGTLALTLSGTQVRHLVAQEGTPPLVVPDATPTGDSEAVQLLNDAAARMAELDTFKFGIVTARGETTIFEGFTLQEITGVVRRPTDFETTVSVEIPFASIDLTAVSVNNEVWIELPEFGENTGGWQSLGSSDGLLSLLNPDVLILQAVPYVDNAAIDRTGDLDGVDVTFVTGQVDFQSIANRVTGEEAALPAEIAEGPVDLTFAIDDDNLVREIEIIGPLLSAEENDVIRLVTFFDFNEPVEIQEPAV